MDKREQQEHHAEVMRTFGWRPIVSDAQAFQLLRRTMKDYLKLCHRYYSAHKWVPEWFLARHHETMTKLKPGSWYRYRQMSPCYKVIEAIE